jgi:UDP-N-acetylglucosamine transferase subunit ALG13
MSTPARPLVAVLLGTDCHRFDRLVEWVRELAWDPRTEWFVQHGCTPLLPGLQGQPLLESFELERLLGRADAVVTHGGPGLIMESRSHGHLPVVVPRDPARQEHVDAHQQQFVARIGAAGLCIPVDGPGALGSAVDRAIAAGRSDNRRPTSGLAVQVAGLVEALVKDGRGSERRRRHTWSR